MPITKAQAAHLRAYAGVFCTLLGIVDAQIDIMLCDVGSTVIMQCDGGTAGALRISLTKGGALIKCEFAERGQPFKACAFDFGELFIATPLDRGRYKK